MTEQQKRPSNDEPIPDQDMIELDETALDGVAGGDKSKHDPTPIVITKHVDTSSPTLN